MKPNMNRRSFLAGSTAVCAFASIEATAALPLTTILSYAKPALEIALSLFKTYVDLQSDLQARQFNEAAVSSITSRLQAIEDGVRRIERDAGDLRKAIRGDIATLFLTEKIADLRSKWGSYSTHMGGKATLGEIGSDPAREQAVEALKELKRQVVNLVEEIKTRGGNNPLIVTPVFSGFRLIKTINARLIEDRGLFDDREKMQKEFNDQLNEQFVKWRAALANPQDKNSLFARMEKLKAELPRLKADVLRQQMLDGSFQASTGINRACGTDVARVRTQESDTRSAACTIRKARTTGQIYGYSKMKFELVDTRVKLLSHHGCPDGSFPAELFDIATTTETIVGRELDFDESSWQEPWKHFRRKQSCRTEEVQSFDALKQQGSKTSGTNTRPPRLEALRKAARLSNEAQAEMLSILSAWVFVAKEPTMDEAGSIFIGMSYKPDPKFNTLFDMPIHMMDKP